MNGFPSADASYVVGDAVRLPVGTSSVDFVVSFETIEHPAEPAEFVAEVAQVLRPDGTFLLSTPGDARTAGQSRPPTGSRKP